MVSETVVELVVQALARREAISAVARSYGLDRKTVRLRAASAPCATPECLLRRSISRLAGAARAGGRV